ncbi:cytochrome C [Stigmatella sp. ncwal1]|uniref:Cytochrome C n=1 Tax=Stigmatella ashevillensis TaxID=2995309 RepID=A0ABT5D1T8_9BACT|nr:cytochrome C [Stigmatella ashevillena]MDC0707618.1 cytochrome C [Stigmatella ashevillena]
MGATLSLAGVLLGSAACDDDDEKPTPPDGGQLSESAAKGLEILGFPLDVSGLTTAEKEQIGRGSYLVNAVGECSGCHNYNSANGPPQYMGGGTPYPIGPGNVVYARNLTSDPDVGMKLTEAEFVEAMRTGRDYLSENDEEVMIVMPWVGYRWMSTADLKAMYAFFRKVPAVKNPIPADIKGPAGAGRPIPFPANFTDGDTSRAIPADDAEYPGFASRGLAIQPLADPPGLASFSAQDKAKYGRGSYLVNAVAECNSCHTNPDRNYQGGPNPNFGKITTAAYLTGGRVFDVPPGLNAMTGYSRTLGANLLGATHSRLPDTYETFRDIMTSGKVAGPEPRRPLGFPMSSAAEAYAKMLDSDLQDIYFYLKSQARRTGAADKQPQPPTHFCTADTDCANFGGTCNMSSTPGQGINQCVGSTCTQDSECGACQTCTAGKCAAPEASSTCPMGGI